MIYSEISFLFASVKLSFVSEEPGELSIKFLTIFQIAWIDKTASMQCGISQDFLK